MEQAANHEASLTRHSLGDVWQAIGKQSDDIATVRTSVASLDARVTHGFASLGQQMNAVLERTNVRPNLAGWLSLAISIALVLAAIGMANLLPIRALAEQNSQHLRELELKVHDHNGYSRGMIEGTEHRLRRAETELDALHRIIHDRNVPISQTLCTGD